MKLIQNGSINFDDKYINWEKESKIWKVTVYEWNELIDKLDKDKWIRDIKSGCKTSRKYWHGGMWRVDFEKRAIYIANGINDYVIYKSTDKDVDNVGSSAISECEDRFKRRTGKSFHQAFGSITGKKTENDVWLIQKLHDINRCVGPFIATDAKLETTITNVYKADLSSAYPANGRKNLPCLWKSKTEKGMIEPTEEWPVAYYLNSGHIAEYGVFDTHIDEFNYLYRYCRNRYERNSKKGEPPIKFKMINDEDEVTLLMKYSDYNLEEFDYYYLMKSIGTDDEKAKAKLVMNSMIGTFDYIPYNKNEKQIQWKSSRYGYKGHIRALILARTNHQIIKYYNEIKNKNYELLAVATDSLLWRGGGLSSTVQNTEKSLGAFISEIENGECWIHGCGSYWVGDDRQFIIKHQGIDNWDENIKSKEQFIDFFNKPRYTTKIKDKLDRESGKYVMETRRIN